MPQVAALADARSSVMPLEMMEKVCAEERSLAPLGSAAYSDPPDEDFAPSRADLGRAVQELMIAVSHCLQNERRSMEECLQRVGAILQISSGSSGPAIAPLNEPVRGGLAPWRIRRLTAHIEANLDTTVTTKGLAALVDLSAFHFCRAFRDSFGDSPHVYLMRRRIERAQGLMLTTNTPLGQIAVDCGLCDQAHFHRLFRRFVGESPGAWRRARFASPPPVVAQGRRDLNRLSGACAAL
jgi:AraC family transcriptional regulator